MTKLSLLFAFTFYVLAAIGQPPNDACAGALSTTPDGTCYGPALPETTTVGAGDHWTGTVGCAGNNDEVWFTFTATGTQLDYTITAGTLGGNVELIVVEATGACSGLTLQGSDCGASPLTGTMTGLTAGNTYYYTISSTGAAGTFITCMTTSTPPPVPGQDCPLANTICDNAGFSVGTISAGAGAISGNIGEENISAISCFGGDERYSQWYEFTVGSSGTIEFSIDPVSWTAPGTGDDYDWALFETTADPLASQCNLVTNGNTAVACNWSGCLGSTGLSPTQFGYTGGTEYQNNNPPGPGTCAGGPQWDATVLNATAGDRFVLLIDNFSLTNNGFAFQWGGTALIGPQADFTLTSCVEPNVTITPTYPNTNGEWTFDITWGDGNSESYTGATLPGSISHNYTASNPPGTYTIAMTVTDPFGCVDTYSSVTCIFLSINLLSFDLKQVYEGIEVKWTTSSEENNDHFLIERSTNGHVFEPIGTTKARGNISTLTNYSFIDNSVHDGLYYYRIVAVDENGYKSYEKAKSIRINNFAENITISPNPNAGNFNIQFPNELEGSFQVKIFNSQGALVYSKKEAQDDRSLNVQMDLSNISSGIYNLVIESETITTRPVKLMINID